MKSPFSNTNPKSYYIFITMLFVLMAMPAFAQNQNVTSEFSTPSYEINKSLDLESQCYNEGLPCQATVTCRFSVYRPDNNAIIVENATMTFIRPGLYNYTLGASQVNLIGVYPANVRCTDGATTASTDASFRIVGKLLYHGGASMSFEIAIGIVFSVIIFIFMLLAVLINKENYPMQFLFFTIGFVMILLSLGIVRGMAISNGVDAGIITLMDDAILLFLVVFVIFFGYIFVEYFKKMWADRKEKQGKSPF